MKQLIKVSVLFTVVTTVICGIIYPLAITGIAQIVFPKQANGSLIVRDGKTIGSELIGQNFSSPAYFHGRPSAAGAGYDATASGGSNLAASNHALVERVAAETAKLQAENPGVAVPIDMVTGSGSGLDPDITPATAEFQIPRVAKARHLSEAELRAFVKAHSQARQFGFLGEARVNVLQLNLALDAAHPMR